jgi:hypothetical protein
MHMMMGIFEMRIKKFINKNYNNSTKKLKIFIKILAAYLISVNSKIKGTRITL